MGIHDPYDDLYTGSPRFQLAGAELLDDYIWEYL